jgi:hypothetical protein
MSYFAFLKNKGSGPIERVKILASIFARDAEGNSAGRNPGDEVDMRSTDVRDLVAAGSAESLGFVTPEGFVPHPPKREKRKSDVYVVEPYPARYASLLPKCFADLWAFREQRAELKHNLNVATKAASIPTMGGEPQMVEWGERHERVVKATEAYRRHLDAGEPRCVLECGRAVLNAIRAANRARDELHNVGFTIFAERLAPLGLHVDHVRRLFQGSALFAKYHMQPMAETPGDLRTAGGYEYVDCSIEGMVNYIESATALRTHCEAKLVEAKAELEAVRNATKPVGKGKAA